MVNDPRRVIQEAFKWVQLTVNRGRPFRYFRILATFFPIPHLARNRRRIKLGHIGTNLSIP
jgi:hypothetical protein